MLGGYLIPRGTMIWCNLNALFSNTNLWDRVDDYIPVSFMLADVLGWRLHRDRLA